jgi:hypothetical protein
MRNKVRSLAMLAGVFGLLEVSGWAQCIMCSTALASSPEGQALAGSFRYGIGVLVAPHHCGFIGYAVLGLTGRKQRIAVWSGGQRASSSESEIWWSQSPNQSHPEILGLTQTPLRLWQVLG